MKRVSELEGAELDYFVAKAEGLDAVIEAGMCQVLTYADSVSKCYSERRYHDSWVNAGPIIEREEIVWTWTQTLDDESMPTRMAIPCRVWDLRHKSPLVAAMRLFVRRKFGDEVDDSQAHHTRKFTPQASLDELAKDDICGKYIVKVNPPE